MTAAPSPIGELVRSWREQRRKSQLDLALDADISQKHLSFIESGRAAPSREMVLLLAEHLAVPLRERNTMLLAAGLAPVFRDRPLTDPALARALGMIDRLLKAQEPYPALVVDGQWNMVRANAALQPLLVAVDPELMKPPVNVLKVSLHPRGLAPFIANLMEWRGHLLDRLRRQIRVTRDAKLDRLMKELTAYPTQFGGARHTTETSAPDDVAVPLKLRTHGGLLSFLSTTTVFGTPVDITLSELILEAFYPADAATATALANR